MFSFLSPDSRFMQVISRITDLVLLNILYLLTCLPLFTAGAATAALYSVCFRIFRNRESSILKSYFRAFRDNFRQGTALWLLELLICVPGIVYFDTFWHMEGPLRYLFAVIFTVLVLTEFAASWAYPWISQFRNNLPTVLRNSLILSLSHLPRSLALLLIRLLPLGLFLFQPELFVRVSFLWFALYFSAAAFMCTAILWKVFKPFYPEETAEKAPLV